MAETKKKSTKKKSSNEESVELESEEKISVNTEKSVEQTKEDKLAKLKEKAKALEKTVKELDQVDLKKKVKGEEEEKKDTLVPMEDYLKASIHLGTRVITPDMRKYVYRRRADGLAVFNTAMLDDELKAGAEYLAQFPPEQMIVVCKREAGWKAVIKFAETFGIRSFTKQYPAGIITNPNLDTFFETDLVFICDPWVDKNALNDANKIKIPVLSVCDTNNYTKGIGRIIPGNNKSAKSLGIIFYLLTKLYAEKRKLDVKIPPIQDFVDGWDDLVPPK